MPEYRIDQIIHSTPEGEHLAEECPGGQFWPCGPEEQPRPAYRLIDHQRVGTNIRLFRTEEDAQRWVTDQLNQNTPGPNFTYFLGFRNADPTHSFGISFGCASNTIPSIKDIFPHIVH